MQIYQEGVPPEPTPGASVTNKQIGLAQGLCGEEEVVNGSWYLAPE